MTKYMTIDTEGSGLFDYAQPADAEGQPRLAELVMVLSDSETDFVTEVHSYLIKPDGWSLSAEAAAVNGLTDEMLAERGMPVVAVLKDYAAMIEAGYVLVGHNVQFDAKQLRAELRRAGMDDMFERTPNICTMRASSSLVGAKNVKGGHKFPTLGETYQHFMGEPIQTVGEGESKCLRDALACHKIMVALHKAGALPEGTVHHAKAGTKAGTALAARTESAA